jgi:endoglucanase
VTHGKTPDAQPPKERVYELKGGPVIGIGPNMTRWMTRRMLDKAKELEIPYQLEPMSGSSGTNGWQMQTVREGIATAVLSLPLKYMHSPVETLEPEDMESAARLISAFVKDLGREGVFLGIC